MSAEIQVVVGLDFGTTYSGFSLYHIGGEIGDIKTNIEWPGELGRFKTNTTLKYEDNFKGVESWGYKALYKKPVELFKLYLGNCLEEYRPKLPEQLNYEQAITDYLREIGKLIKETIPKYWRDVDIDFTENVLLVLTVPAEYSEKDKSIMRECAFEAGLISNKNSEKLRLTTEPEAAAIYCIYDSGLRECGLTIGTTFMVVDCGGGTVDLTTRKLLEGNQLSEVTELAGDFCGSTFIDKKFIELLKREVGDEAVELFSDEHYGTLQHLIQEEFCRHVKLPFTGDEPNFKYDMDIEMFAPYVNDDSVKNLMKEKEWLIKFDFDTIKSMFDPIVDRIIKMIRAQLDNSSGKSSGKCSSIYLVGGFSESKYLQKRVKEEFSRLVENISIPNEPVAAVVRGAAIYGKSLQESGSLKDRNNLKFVIETRVLRHTFGIRESPPWKVGDPPERRTSGRRIHKFRRIAERMKDVTMNDEVKIEDIVPAFPLQTKLSFSIYYTKEQDAVYCDEPGMKLLGKLHIDLPDVDLGINRPCTLGLLFGDSEIKAKAFNQTNGQNYQTTFELSDY